MRHERTRGAGWSGVLLALMACLGGCDDPPPVERFEESELLLGVAGSYKLDVQNVGSASAYRLRVEGDAVSARLATDEDRDWRVVLLVDTLAEGVSVVELLHHGRVVDSLVIEVAVATELHAELVLDFEQVILTEPWAVLVDEVVVIRLVGSDARGRVFDRFWRELLHVDPGIQVQQLFRNYYELDAGGAGAFTVTATVGGGGVLATTVHVLERAAISSIRVEFRTASSVVVIGTSADGRRVQLVDATVQVDGEAASSWAPGLYEVGEDRPLGTVITASWSELTATYTL